MAKNVWDDERTLLNGNRYTFIEPLEATSTTTYATIIEFFAEYLNGEITNNQLNKKTITEVAHISLFATTLYTGFKI